MTCTPTQSRKHGYYISIQRSLVRKKSQKNSTGHPKLGACEWWQAIYRLTPVREITLSLCCGSALHKSEEEGVLNADTTLKVFAPQLGASRHQTTFIDQVKDNYIIMTKQMSFNNFNWHT